MKSERILKVEALKETLTAIEECQYTYKNEIKRLKLNKNEMSKIRVYSKEEIDEFVDKLDKNENIFKSRDTIEKRIEFTVVNCDSYEAAFSLKDKAKGEDVLVLNFANPINPGGGVRTGANAQEESLCRQSTLLASLESEEAARYYEYNKKLKGYWGSDLVAVSPKVEIIKKEEDFLDDSFVVAVITASAPSVTSDEHENPMLKKTIYNRILGILSVAAREGYKHLVLGAWGCGAFGNDAKMMACEFERTLKNFHQSGKYAEDYFDNIVMAVLDTSYAKYNYKCFAEQFNSYYKELEEREAKKITEHINHNENKYFTKIMGSIIGGAVGDALGYSVEFRTLDEIKRKFGRKGITQYELVNGKALISDDTQMTLFTACGIMYGETRMALRGVMAEPEIYIYDAYLDWLEMQTGKESKNKISWLLDVPELKNRRAPGFTCIEALESEKMGTIENEINDSKGCGGIMRVAPIALYYHFKKENIDELDLLGAKAAAITHGHDLGYMPGAAFVHIVSRAAFGGCVYGDDLYHIVLECRDTMERIFKDKPDISYMLQLMDKAVELSNNSDADEINIKSLGEGWCSEETLAIAIYCCLRHSENFEDAVIAAVNHDGDSDSTGAVVGNIMGAYLGIEEIGAKWINCLELKETIEEIALDLSHKCQMKADNSYMDEQWIKKYVR